MGPQGVLPGFESLAVSLEVLDERERQNELWGTQDHEILRSSKFSREAVRELYVRWAEDWKRSNDLRVKREELVWEGILLEEVYEALAEEDPQKQREELIQVAAVAQAMVECIDRKANLEKALDRGGFDQKFIAGVSEEDYRKEARDPYSESSASTEQSVSTGAAKG